MEIPEFHFQMACVTLKRSLDLEPLYSPNGSVAKKRRCMPLTPLFARNNQGTNDKTFASSSKNASGKFELKRNFSDVNPGASNSNCPSQTFSSLPMPSSGEPSFRVYIS